jgi:hypothetical protein
MPSKVQQKSPVNSLVQRLLNRVLLFSVSLLCLGLIACSSPKKTAPVKDYSSGRKVESTSSAKTTPIQSSKVTAKSDPVKEPSKVAKEAVKDTNKETVKEVSKEASKEPKKEISKEVAKTDSKPSETKTLETKDPKEPNPSLDSGLKLAKPASGQTITGFDGNTNKGIDISGKLGDPIFAAADGRVVYAGDGMLFLMVRFKIQLTRLLHQQPQLMQLHLTLLTFLMVCICQTALDLM